jgi:hypothetical protein
MPEEFEEITEAMAEKLTDQIPELLKKIDALQKNKSASRYHKIELQKWIDKVNIELLNLKETVSERKHLYFKTLSDDVQLRLADRHPVWMRDFNLYFDQIKDLIAIHKDESTIVRCLLKTNTLRSLEIFYYASNGNVLTINSNKNLKYVGSEVPPVQRDNAEHKNVIDRPTGEYIFLPIPEGHAQWIFKGNRWGIDKNILWLDFGKSKGDESSDALSKVT